MITYRLIAEVDGETVATSQAYASLTDLVLVADLVQREAETKLEEAAEYAEFMETLDRDEDPAEYMADAIDAARDRAKDQPVEDAGL